jgi:hypothetical protein
VATTTLTGTTGNDILNTPGSVTTLAAGLQGNDTITLARVDDEVQAGAGNDAINVALASNLVNTIFGGSGNDTVTLTSAVGIGSQITLGDGDDLIVVTAGQLSNASIGGNAGADVLTFVAGANSSTVGGGKNNDSIAFTAGTITNTEILGGGGKDTIRISNAVANALTTVQAGDGHDLILVTGAATFSSNGVIAAGKGLDSLFLNNGAIATVAGGGMSDTITFFSNVGVGAAIFGAGNGVVSGGTSDTGDSIATTAALLSSVSIFGGAGNDTINFNSANAGTLIAGGDNNDLIGNTANLSLVNAAGSAVTINGGDGKDTISLLAATAGSLILGGGGHDSITLNMTGGVIGAASVNGGAGLDTINISNIAGLNTGGFLAVTVNGGGGADSIMIGSPGTATVAQFGQLTPAATALTLITAGFLGSVVFESGDTIAITTAFNAAAGANFVGAASTLFVRSSLTGLAQAITGSGAQGAIGVFDNGADMIIGIAAGNATTGTAFINVIGGGSLIGGGTAITGDSYTINTSNFGFTVSEINAAGGINITFN